MFENVSNDSNFDLSISGYSFVLPEAGQTQPAFAVTTAEQVENWVGTLTAVVNASFDTKPPFIKSVASSIGAPGTTPNMLEPGFDGTTGIVFNMSEAVTQTVDATNVSVWSETLGAYKAVASVVQTATTLTVTLTDAIAKGEIVQVLFQMNEIRDGAGNLFTITEPVTNLAYTTANVTQSTYAQVRLQGHFVADTSAAITLAQTWSEASTDAYEDSDGTVQVGVNRLNSDAADSSTRLENRLDAQDDGLLNTSGSAVVGTTATISVAQTAGTKYILDVPVGTTAVKNAATTAVVLPATYAAGITNTALIVEGVAVGGKVSVTPLDDFGNPGTKQTITLTDNVPATTALQESYGLGEVASLVFGGGVTTVIDGGENSVAGTAGTAGDPLIYVTPRLLAGSDASWAADILAGNQIFTGLGDLPTASTLTNGAAPQAITSEAYTAAQWAAFAAAPVAATFGVSFTEAVTVTGAPAWTGTSTLTGWTAAADSASSNDTSDVLVNSNFVGLTVTTNDVLTLGNIDANNSTANAVNFTDTVADKASNNSGVDSKARVAFVDALPPFVVSAALTVPAFTVVFNESINDTDWETEVLAMTLQDDAGDATSLSAAGFVSADLSISTDGKTVTFDNTGLSTGQFTALIGLFSNGAIETVLDTSEVDDSYDFAENGTLRGHARLNFSGVSDAVADNNLGAGLQTNTWSAYVNDIYDFNGVAAAAGATNMNVAPLFMAWSEIPEFGATLNLVSGINADKVFTLTLTTGNGLAFDLDASFDQAVGSLTNVTNANVASGPLALTGTQVDNLLNTSNGGVTIVTGSSSGLIAQGGTAISFSVTFSGGLVINDQILFDNTALHNANQVVDTLGRLDPVQAVVVPLN